MFKNDLSNKKAGDKVYDVFTDRWVPVESRSYNRGDPYPIQVLNTVITLDGKEHSDDAVPRYYAEEVRIVPVSELKDKEEQKPCRHENPPIEELRYGHEKQESSNEFWQIGKDYVVRTVTMIYLGTLKATNQTELLLEDCAWIPDTSRWSEFLNGKKPNEMEPYKEDVIIGRGAILDATIMTQKIKRELI